MMMKQRNQSKGFRHERDETDSIPVMNGKSSPLPLVVGAKKRRCFSACVVSPFRMFLLFTTLFLLLPLLLLCNNRRSKNNSEIPVVYSCTEKGVRNFRQPNQEFYADDRMSYFLQTHHHTESKEYDALKLAYDRFKKERSKKKAAHKESSKQRLYQPDTENMTHFLQTYRESEYDAWMITYDEFKERSRAHKSRFILPHVRSGDAIYESATGLGLNLYMTLELLLENNPDLRDITVYGNEYLETSSVRANRILDALLEKGSMRMKRNNNFRKGTLCPGDSTDLHFVPSDSFDVVYTGYISPLVDPLEIGRVLDEKISIYQTNGYLGRLCKGSLGANDTWQTRYLLNAVQQKQNDHVGTWVSEMVRIAKPGAPVIVEQASPSFCDSPQNWGGVDRNSFWTSTETHSRYRWDIDPSSIEMINETDHGYRDRYHVFMRKN